LHRQIRRIEIILAAANANQDEKAIGKEQPCSRRRHQG
jgi:hypothetical protein